MPALALSLADRSEQLQKRGRHTTRGAGGARGTLLSDTLAECPRNESEVAKARLWRTATIGARATAITAAEPTGLDNAGGGAAHLLREFTTTKGIRYAIPGSGTDPCQTTLDAEGAREKSEECGRH